MLNSAAYLIGLQARFDNATSWIIRCLAVRTPGTVGWRKNRLLEFTLIVCVLCVTTVVNSSAQTLTTLVSFDERNGAQPQSSVIQGPDGNFYGTTYAGGACNTGSGGCGTVFKITPNGSLTTLYNFCSRANCVDGIYPEAGLVQGLDGNFYGTTYAGGLCDTFSGGCGTIFRITPSGTLTTIYSFCSQPQCADGAFPAAGLTRGSDGNLYGTTAAGGSSTACFEGCGTAFKITISGTLNTLYSFCTQTNCADGRSPRAGLVQGSDGSFYGTTSAGVHGTVFKMTSSGTLTTLHSFNGSGDGSAPVATLVQATNGNLYGTTSTGGSGSAGTLFSITPSGMLTTLHDFCSQSGCADGSTPLAGLMQATDGNLYGTTSAGGSNSGGAVFTLTLNGVINTYYNFCSHPNCTDGASPAATLLQATDGNFYGTTSAGGTNGGHGDGTVFKLSAPDPSPAQFVPMTPCRLVDTRPQNGGSGALQSDNFETFDLPLLAQSKDCGDLSSAAAYSLNVTLIPQNGAPVGYLTIWPAGKNQPLVSTMNSLDGRIKANAAIVPAGASGAVSVFVTNTANIVLDIDGYFAPPTQSTLAFYPLPPCRVADTRSSNYPQGLGTPNLSGGIARNFPVLNSPCIPANVSAEAYSFNITAVPYPRLGDALNYLEVWPTGQEPQNSVSTLNNLTGTYVANAAVVVAGGNGEITTLASNDTDLLIDIDGYFASPAQGGLSLYPTVPCRVIDTRNIGNGQPFSGTLNPPVDIVSSGCAVSDAAQAYVFNATVIPLGDLSYLTLWPDGQGQPSVSTLNAADGWVTSNMAVVPNIDGKTDAYAAGTTQLILDISSYFAP